MADTILTGDVTVAYLDESRQKRIYWSGGANTYTMNQLYSALMNHFDEPAQMDNPSPMSAQTPREYSTGIIDTGDNEPWYITYDLMEHMTGGALRTLSWTRDLPGDDTGAIGIVVVPVTAAGNTIVASDEGNTISHADGDSGTLLEVISNGGTNDYLIIRPDTNALADDWNSTTGVVTVAGSSNTGTQNAAAVTGEQIWANLYSLGTIEPDTHIYLYQGAVDGAAKARVYSVNSNTADYWGTGHVDVCVPIRNWQAADAPVIDSGYLTAFARKTTVEYSHFEGQTSTTSGGRNPIPLGTKADLNQTTGTGNLAWDNGTTGDTLLDADLLYNAGTTTVGNLAAGVQDDGGVFTDDTTDLNDVAGGGDVPVHPATTGANDAFYFGMNDQFTLLMVDVTTAATATAAGTTWEYWDGTTWSALTVVDDSDSANGFATAGTGRYLVSWLLPTDWETTTVTNQPAALVKPYYVRIRVSNATNYTAGATLETAWAAGVPQLKGVVRDSTITTPAGATGNTDYFLVGEPQTNFSDNDVVIAFPSRKTFDIQGAPTAQGPALTAWFTTGLPSISFTAQTYDTDDDGTVEYYGIDIDCNSNPLTEVYEWLKYILRNGGTTTANSDGIEGEQYIGGQAMLAYTVNDVGDLAEGDYVTQEVTGASGIIVSMDESGATNYILLRSTRGTFEQETAANNRTVTNSSTGSIEINSGVANFAPNSVSPFGTFAGGTFFGARGVLLSNWVTADENSFQLTPIEGGTKSRPESVQLTLTNLVGTDETTVTDDRVAIFRLTGAGGQIDKTEYSAVGGETPGDATLDVDGTIAVDTPGKAGAAVPGGVVRLRDADDNNQEYRLRYASWTGSQFTLANFAAFTTTATTNSTQVTYATGGFNANVRRGDLVYNSTVPGVSYVASVDSDTQLTINPAITGQTDGDTVEINCIPITVNTADDVYVPLMDRYALSGTETVSMTYDTQINFRVVARNSANNTKIIPFSANDVTTGADRSTSVVRNPDTIIT